MRIVFVMLVGLFVGSSSMIYAQNNTPPSTPDRTGRATFGSTPDGILRSVVEDEQSQRSFIQNTTLNNVTSTGTYPMQYRLANTFDSIRRAIGPYIDWMFYIGLSVSVILIIRNGLQLVVGKTFADIRKPMINIIIGVIVLTSVYVIIQLVTGLLSLVFNIV